MAAVSWCAVSCSVSGRLADISAEMPDADIVLPHDVPHTSPAVEETYVDEEPDSLDGPVLMNAVKDTETGEMVAVDFIRPSRVEARFRNVAERSGEVTVEFDIIVPETLVWSGWQLRIFPEVLLHEDTLRLDPVLVTGEKYRSSEMRGYARYRALVSSILTDSTDFLMMRQLEIFLERNCPEVYAMKHDTSFVSQADAAGIFGVSRDEVVRHYTRAGLVSRNARRRQRSGQMLERLISGLSGMIRLDTVVTSSAGEMCLRYSQTLRCRPGLRKIPVILSGGIYEDGEEVYALPGSSRLVFYVSSLSSLADTTLRYRTVVLSRRVYDYTNVILDFRQSSAVLDTLSEGNAAEISRMRKCLAGLSGHGDIVTDSVVVTASCSMEGRYSFNSDLAAARAEAVTELLSCGRGRHLSEIFRRSSVPENWEMFMKLVASDTSVSCESLRLIGGMSFADDPDGAEKVLQTLPEYRYFREKIYPRLRTVRLDFYMHRKGMVKDTVMTSEVDTFYMKGVEALKNLDYPAAVEILGRYEDYNAALAYLSSGYDRKALTILSRLSCDLPEVLYLKALALSRMGMDEEASALFDRCVTASPAMLHRGRLDPEIRKFTFKYDN